MQKNLLILTAILTVSFSNIECGKNRGGGKAHRRTTRIGNKYSQTQLDMVTNVNLLVERCGYSLREALIETNKTYGNRIKLPKSLLNQLKERHK